MANSVEGGEPPSLSTVRSEPDDGSPPLAGRQGRFPQCARLIWELSHNSAFLGRVFCRRITVADGDFSIVARMARKLRVEYPRAICHGMNRGDLPPALTPAETGRPKKEKD